MKVLLDTQIFVWLDSEPEKLSPQSKNVLEEPENQIYLSVVSIWELQIKSQLGKLTLERSLKSILESQQEINGLEILSIETTHIFALENLPYHHKDPFDRLLISQAKTENLSLLTADHIFSKYEVELIKCI
jgi:PIN domain nuclease of toxin-antitoxin system